MLITDIERYLSFRQTLGLGISEATRFLRSFARFAADKGDTHIRSTTAIDWASLACSPSARQIHLRHVVHLARFLHAEDQTHEVPGNPFNLRRHRILPYIYNPDEVGRLIAAAERLRESYPLRRFVYATLFGLIAATGLRISEALNLRLDNILPDGILQVQNTKFGKSRLVPLHPTAAQALNRYLDARCRLAVVDDHVFLSAHNERIPYSTVDCTFRRMRQNAGIAPDRSRPPRIHDLRHTLATRVLEQCSMQRETVGRQFVALSTYLGHTSISDTYWYLEATPELMTKIAMAAETAWLTGEEK